MRGTGVIALLLLASLLLPASVWGEAETAKKTSLEKRVLELEKEVTALKREVSFYRLAAIPEQPSVCDKPLPLSTDDGRERFEREFYQFLENKGLLTILVKRYRKFLNVISDEITRAEMPPDLIYLAMTESYLNPRTVSKANAGGMWQFIKETGKREGLYINECIDERYSVKRSTRSALLYLKKLHNEFGDWLIAMAAYNAGEARLREAIANQGTRDFFELHLPEETERYIFRIGAMKEILSNPRKYGLALETRDYYRPFSIVEFTVELKKDLHTSVLAQAMDVPYKTFRQFNLHIRRYTLPKGVYYIYAPAEKKSIFTNRIKACPGISMSES